MSEIYEISSSDEDAVEIDLHSEDIVDAFASSTENNEKSVPASSTVKAVLNTVVIIDSEDEEKEPETKLKKSFEIKLNENYEEKLSATEPVVLDISMENVDNEPTPSSEDESVANKTTSSSADESTANENSPSSEDDCVAIERSASSEDDCLATERPSSSEDESVNNEPSPSFEHVIVSNEIPLTSEHKEVDYAAKNFTADNQFFPMQNKTKSAAWNAFAHDDDDDELLAFIDEIAKPNWEIYHLQRQKEELMESYLRKRKTPTLLEIASGLMHDPEIEKNRARFAEEPREDAKHNVGAQNYEPEQFESKAPPIYEDFASAPAKKAKK